MWPVVNPGGINYYPRYDSDDDDPDPSIQFPSIAGKWQGEYTIKKLEDPDDPTSKLVEDWSGLITIVLKQKDFKSEISMKLTGTATITDWILFDEGTNGQIINGTICFENQNITSVSIPVKYGPVQYEDEEEEYYYYWVIQALGQVDPSSDTLRCSISIVGPPPADDPDASYSKIGSVTLTK